MTLIQPCVLSHLPHTRSVGFLWYASLKPLDVATFSNPQKLKNVLWTLCWAGDPPLQLLCAAHDGRNRCVPDVQLSGGAVFLARCERGAEFVHAG